MKFDGKFVELLTHFLASMLEIELFMNEKDNVLAELNAEKWLYYVISATM
jgi:hypothetical protein